jgi:hypothetical protein
VAYAVYRQLPGGIAVTIQLSTACVPAEILNENIPNESLQRYHYIALFAKMCIFGYLDI